MKMINTNIRITPTSYTYFEEVFSYDWPLCEYLAMLERHPLIEVVSFVSSSSCGGNPEIKFGSADAEAIKAFQYEMENGYEDQ